MATLVFFSLYLYVRVVNMILVLPPATPMQFINILCLLNHLPTTLTLSPSELPRLETSP